MTSQTAVRSQSGRSQTLGVSLVVLWALAALLAPVLAPHDINERFANFPNAPPTRPHVVDDAGSLHAPFIYRWRLVDRLLQTYQEDRSVRVPLAWFRGGRILTSADEGSAPLLLLGADSYGKDVFSRVLYGARLSLGLALASALGAVLLGASLGGLAGYFGGALDDALMRMTDVVMVLPGMYVVLALRAVLPPVMPAAEIFFLLSLIFAIVGAPFIARGVRAIVRAERAQDYASAAQALGASHLRVLTRHLLPAARGFIAVEMTLLVPAFIVAEATLSFVGLGFPDRVASWGTMLQDASRNVRVFAEFPWLLSPAAAMFLVVLGLNLALEGKRTEIVM